MPHYTIFVGSFGEYRVRVLELLKEQFGDSLTLMAGQAAPWENIRCLNSKDIRMLDCRNIYIGRYGFVQIPPAWKVLLLSDSVVVDLNPRSISAWLLLSLRRTLGKRTIVWGHAFPRKGAKYQTDKLRSIMRSLANSIITYTHTQRLELLKRDPGLEIYSAPNSLYYRNEIEFRCNRSRDAFVYVGRLVPDKKPLLLVRAFILAKRNGLPSAARLVILGDGPELPKIELIVKTEEMSNSIELIGFENSYNALQSQYSSAIASVCPGYAGLSVTQSLSFGVPIIVSRKENHSPEIEAVIDGFNARFFKSDDVESLAFVLNDFWIKKYEWDLKGEEIAYDCSKKYSIECMASGIADAIRGV